MRPLQLGKCLRSGGRFNNDGAAHDIVHGAKFECEFEDSILVITCW